MCRDPGAKEEAGAVQSSPSRAKGHPPILFGTPPFNQNEVNYFIFFLPRKLRKHCPPYFLLTGKEKKGIAKEENKIVAFLYGRRQKSEPGI